MKIAFYKATRPGIKGIYNYLVRWVDGGPYSHVELVFKDGVSASSSWLDGGVRFADIEYRPEHWDIFELPDELEPHARKWFRDHAGAKYDVLGNLKFVLWFVPHSKTRWFCSEAIAEALQLPESWRYGPSGLASLVKWLCRK